MNQSPTEKIDKTGGDVTKAELVETPTADKTSWDLLNNAGVERTDAQAN